MTRRHDGVPLVKTTDWRSTTSRDCFSSSLPSFYCLSSSQCCCSSYGVASFAALTTTRQVQQSHDTVIVQPPADLHVTVATTFIRHEDCTKTSYRKHSKIWLDKNVQYKHCAFLDFDVCTFHETQWYISPLLIRRNDSDSDSTTQKWILYA